MTPEPLFSSPGPVTLVGAGPVDHAVLARALEIAPEVVAADGGAAVPLPAGHGFRAVIGDMDSAPEGAAGPDVPVHFIDDQNSTDLEKCLRFTRASLWLGVGFIGGRLDHELAALHALLAFPEKRVVLIGGEDVCFLCPEEGFAFGAEEGMRVSLFPLAQVTGTRETGLRWPLRGREFAPGKLVGTSNVALGGRIEIGFSRPGVLVILPQAMLRQVCAVLPEA